MGLGAVFGGESAGIFLKQSVSGIFSYKVPLSSKQFLAFGLGAGFRRQSVNFSALNADAPEEFYNWPQQQSSILPDASFGFLYAFKKLYITAAANQVFASAFEYQDPHLDQIIRFKTLSDYEFLYRKLLICTVVTGGCSLMESCGVRRDYRFNQMCMEDLRSKTGCYLARVSGHLLACMEI